MRSRVTPQWFNPSLPNLLVLNSTVRFHVALAHVESVAKFLKENKPSFPVQSLSSDQLDNDHDDNNQDNGSYSDVHA
jgi:hypothetical protein